ncbi:MAG TPA: formate/nitrite transporter family protein [Anaerolineaceae bacterium]|jgi:formate/nitrite transporter|nr:formate/nitrite transporter family protein [Anaerolineaceae bacterium]HUM63264.1 formate/nitrite transporter family protein [Anaerolineaceae bacterium]
MLKKVHDIGMSKARLRILPLFLLAVLAGVYIAFGGVFSTIISTGMVGFVPYGVMKTLQGLVFSLGLILVVVAGAELFTGNMLMVVALANRKISFVQLFRNWGLVYAGNFIGSLLVAGLMLLARTYTFSSGELGKNILSIANAKLGYSFIQAFALGILCNILVCLAVWLSFSAKNTTDKILSVIFPITAFIAAGFEHCVANMYLIPVAIFLRRIDPEFVVSTQLSAEALNWSNFIVKNLLPVSLGNILGGALFVGLIYFLAYKNHPEFRDSEQ